MAYVDGFVIPVPRKNLEAYRTMARKAGDIWMEHGAIEYRECVSEDLKAGGMMSFSKLTRLKAGEVVMFSWIVYKSKSQRIRVNAKVLKDPRILKMMENEASPFDMRRMSYGGFEVIVDKR